MKDRYLFRGKRAANGEWVYGYFMMSEPSQFTKKTRPVIVDSQSGIAEYVDPDTIGQCTGVKDTHGDLIFEGDLLRWYENADPDDPGETITGQVSWKRCGWAIFFDKRIGRGRISSKSKEAVPLDADIDWSEWEEWEEWIDWEIIGNIHDNPELL